MFFFYHFFITIMWTSSCRTNHVNYVLFSKHFSVKRKFFSTHFTNAFLAHSTMNRYKRSGGILLEEFFSLLRRFIISVKHSLLTYFFNYLNCCSFHIPMYVLILPYLKYLFIYLCSLFFLFPL